MLGFSHKNQKKSMNIAVTYKVSWPATALGLRVNRNQNNENMDEYGWWPNELK